MKVTELTKKIHDDHPEVWEKLKEYIDERSYGEGLVFIGIYENEIKYTYKRDDGSVMTYVRLNKVPLNMLYAFLEDFFEENGIIIEITYHTFSKLKWSGRVIDLKLVDTRKLYYFLIDSCGTEPETKTQTILRACKIMR